MENKREFKGVWIPKEIFLNDDLSWTERILLIEIDSLDNEEGCFASNEYLSKFLRVSEITISNAISKLKKKGYVKQVYFDGRRRILKSCIKINLKSDLKETLRQDKSKLKGTIKENFNSLYKSNNTINNTINNTTNNDFSENEKSNFDNFKSFSVKEEKKERKSSAKKTGVIYPFNDQDFIDAWQLWKDYKKEQFRFTYKGTISEQAALKQLSDKSGNNKMVAIWIIRASIANGWMGLFKQNNNDKQKHSAGRYHAGEQDYSKTF